MSKKEKEEEVVEEVVEEKERKPAKKPAAKKAVRSKEQSQIIYIGKKNTISYVLVAVTILNKSDQCNIQARGRQISKAVDVAEITRRKFLQDMVEVGGVNIGSEEIQSDIDANLPPKTVSTIEIILKKGK
ncbi:MAG: RNA-binding protein [Candidatus Heimdallarchaeaceae archaeon]